MAWSDRPGIDRGPGAVPPPRRSEDELLALVYAKAGSGRRPPVSSAMVGVAAAVLLVAGIVSLVGRDGDGDGPDTEVRAAAPGGRVPAGVTTTTKRLTVSVVMPPSLPPIAAPPATPAPTVPAAAIPAAPVTRPAGVTATTTVACRNSGDPACGPFRWDPTPGANQPLTVQVTPSSTAAKVGIPVTFTVVGVDPDAEVVNRIGQFGDGTSAPWGVISGCESRFGPWDPPVSKPGRMEFTVEHVYASAGTYTATFELQSAAICDHPYGSTGRQTVTVTVSP